MLVLRYFVYVGAVLLALIFVAGRAFPTAPADDGASATVAAADAPMIRIHSDRKWPERVQFDTSAPAFTPAPTQTASVVASAKVASVQPNVAVRDAFAQLTPPEVKKPEPKPVQKRRVAKRRVPPPPMQMQVAQRPQFGLFANNLW